jgi:hypothetical protein
MAKNKLKDFEVTLFYHQAVIVKVQAEDAESAVEKAYQADFEDPGQCIQCGWEEDGEPEVTEV